MKKPRLHILPLMAFMLAALCSAWVSSCTNDIYSPDDEPSGAPETQQARFLSVKLHSISDGGFDDGHPDYVDGSDAENAINFTGLTENVIIYFDPEYNYKGYSPLDFDKLSVMGSSSTGEAEEVAYMGFMTPSFEEFFSLPSYGMIVLNAHDICSALDELNEREGVMLTDVLQLVDTSDKGHMAGRSNGYFTMSSTAYLEQQSGQWIHSILFEIDKTKIFTSRFAAIMQPAAEAYVERMSAKFTLALPGAEGGKGLDFIPDNGRAQVIVCRYINGESNYSNQAWTLTVEGWGINKYEPTQYYFRNIVPEGMATNAYPFDFGPDINSAGQPYFYGWNRAKDHRTFWAVDPHYSTGIYPGQYRPAVDNSLVDYFGKKGPASLAYLSYEDLSTDFSHLEREGGVSLYSTENTFPDTRLGGIWQHALAGSELVVGARMHVKGIDESKADYDLYRNRIGVFYPSKTDFAHYFIETFNNQLNSQSSMTFRYYDWNNPGNNSGNVIHVQDIPYGDYKLYYKDAPLTPEIMASLAKNTMPALIENGDGKVIPWIDGMYIGRRDKDPNTYEEIGEIKRLAINENDFKSLIYDWIGAFDHFNRGRMIYTAPIMYQATTKNTTVNTYRPVVGDYGVVRNAWYRFSVTEILNIGTPIDDITQPIIPYETNLENSIMMEIDVMDWHVFSTDVTLPGLK